MKEKIAAILVWTIVIVMAILNIVVLVLERSGII